MKTKEEINLIQEMNKAILNSEFSKPHHRRYPNKPPSYHKRWDFLMPVILNIKLNYVINNGHILWHRIIDLPIWTPIESAHKLIFQLITELNNSEQ